MSAKLNSKQDAKKCILEAAAKLFSKCGLDKTSTRDISKDSQSNISLISYHFGGKEGLYREVIREFAEKVRDKVQPTISEFRSQPMTKELFQKEVESMVSHMIEMRMSHPEISVILAREKIEGMPQCKEVHEEVFFPMIQNFFEMFKAAQDKGIVRAGLHPALFFVLLSEGVFGFFEVMDCKTKLNEACQDLINDHNLLKQQVVDTFLNGVLV